MRWTIAYGIVPALACLLAPDQESQPANSDQAAIQGTWEIVSAERAGTLVKVQPGLRFAFKDNQCRKLLGESSADDSTFNLLPDTKPKGIDLFKPKDDRVTKGIYRLEGDTLTLAIPNGPSRDRPRELVSKDGDGISILNLKRAANDKPAAVPAEIEPAAPAPK